MTGLSDTVTVGEADSVLLSRTFDALRANLHQCACLNFAPRVLRRSASPPLFASSLRSISALNASVPRSWLRLRSLRLTGAYTRSAVRESQNSAINTGPTLRSSGLPTAAA